MPLFGLFFVDWSTLFVLGLLIFTGLYFFNKKATIGFGRWFNANLGEALRNVADTSPIAQLNQAVANATAKIESGKKGAAGLGALKRQLEASIRFYNSEETRLMELLQATKDNGDPHNTRRGYAEQLAANRSEKAATEAQLTSIRQQYDDFIADIREGDQTIREAEQQARLLKAKLSMSESKKAAAEFARSFDPTAATGELAESVRRVEQQINENEATVEVGQLGGEQRRGERKDRQALRAAAADKILAELDSQSPQQV